MSRQLSRVVYNALPLAPSGGGVSTYIRELLAAMPGAVDASLVAEERQLWGTQGAGSATETRWPANGPVTVAGVRQVEMAVA